MPVLAGRLAHVEIEIFTRHHHRPIPFRRGIQTGFYALPAVYAALLGECPRAHRLVPHRGPLAVRSEYSGHALHEEVLQPVRIVRPETRHQCPAVGAAGPLGHFDLVAAHMDVLRGEQLAQFTQNVLQQRVILLAGHAPRRAVIVSVGRNRVGRIVAADFGMHRGDVAAVPREVDLGNDLDVPLGGITDQSAHLLLREVTAVFPGPLAIYGSYGRIAAAETSDLRQFGVRFDLDAPPFVVRKMQV